MDKKMNGRVKSNLMLYLAGILVSRLGTLTYAFAVSLYILKIGGTAAQLSLNLFLSMTARVVLSPIAGSIVDRWDRKRIVVFADLISGVFLMGIFFIVTETSFTLPLIYLSTLVLSVLNTFFGVAFNAAIPNFVDGENVARANSIAATADSISGILGPVLGGFMFALVDIKMFILVNAISFIISGVSEQFIDFTVNPSKSSVSGKLDFREDFRVSVAYLKKNKYIMNLALTALIINFFAASLSVINPIVIINHIGHSSKTYGVIDAAFGIGVLLVSMFLSIRPQKKNGADIVANGIVVLGFLFFLYTIPVMLKDINWFINAAMIFAVAFSFGAIIIAVNIPLNSGFLRLLDDDVRGKMIGILGAVAGGIAPLGTVLTGVLIDHVSPIIILSVSGLGIVACSLLIKRNKELREKYEMLIETAPA